MPRECGQRLAHVLRNIRYEMNEVMAVQSSDAVRGKGSSVANNVQRIENQLTKCSDDSTESKLEYGNLKIFCENPLISMLIILSSMFSNLYYMFARPASNPTFFFIVLSKQSVATSNIAKSLGVYRKFNGLPSVL